MNHIPKAVRVALNAKTKQNVFFASKIFARYSSITTWNKDWKPGPYPRTKEERLAAAKKYNLLPEDYEPYPEEEGYGDYPMFPIVHNENKSDFEVYDFPVMKRNYGEPIHPDFDICLEDRVNFQKKYWTPIWKQFLYVVVGVTLYTGLVLLDQAYPRDLCLAPKQYPYKGLNSYTFEPAE